MSHPPTNLKAPPPDYGAPQYPPPQAFSSGGYYGDRFREYDSGSASCPPPNQLPQVAGHTTGYPVPVVVTTIAPGAHPPPCMCSAGWILFGFGFLVPILWIVAMFIPLCTKDINDRRAQIASAIALGCSVMLWIFLAIA